VALLSLLSRAGAADTAGPRGVRVGRSHRITDTWPVVGRSRGVQYGNAWLQLGVELSCDETGPCYLLAMCAATAALKFNC
jgi:hypothetical protein